MRDRALEIAAVISVGAEFHFRLRFGLGAGRQGEARGEHRAYRQRRKTGDKEQPGALEVGGAAFEQAADPLFEGVAAEDAERAARMRESRHFGGD